jgi:hypothetical protein
VVTLVYICDMSPQTCQRKSGKSWTHGGKIGSINLWRKEDCLGIYPSHCKNKENLRNVCLSAVDRVWLRHRRLQKTREVFARTASLCLHSEQQDGMDCGLWD